MYISLRRCVKVMVDVPDCPYGLCERKATLNLKAGHEIESEALGCAKMRTCRDVVVCHVAYDIMCFPPRLIIPHKMAHVKSLKSPRQ